MVTPSDIQIHWERVHGNPFGENRKNPAVWLRRRGTGRTGCPEGRRTVLWILALRHQHQRRCRNRLEGIPYPDRP